MVVLPTLSSHVLSEAAQVILTSEVTLQISLFKRIKEGRKDSEKLKANNWVVFHKSAALKNVHHMVGLARSGLSRAINEMFESY